MKTTMKREQKQARLFLPGMSSLKHRVVRIRLLSVLATATILFASCNNDTEEINDGHVKFSSGVNTVSRVGGGDGDQWEVNDNIGIYMIGHSDELVKENAENIRYTTTSAGANATFTPGNTAETIYYPVDITQKVDFIAYHPYNASVNNYIYPVDLTNQGNQSAIDLMMAQKANNNGAGYDKTNILPVNLIFTHQLAKVILNVSAGAGVNNLDGLVVNIKGMYTKADFDISDPTGLKNITDIGDIIPYKQPANNTYEVILLPVVLDVPHIVEFEVGGNTYSWNMTINTSGITALAQGQKYIFNIEIHKNGVSVSGTITKWIDGGSSNGEAV